MSARRIGSRSGGLPRSNASLNREAFSFARNPWICFAICYAFVMKPKNKRAELLAEIKAEHVWLRRQEQKFLTKLSLTTIREHLGVSELIAKWPNLKELSSVAKRKLKEAEDAVRSRQN